MTPNMSRSHSDEKQKGVDQKPSQIKLSCKIYFIYSSFTVVALLSTELTVILNYDNSCPTCINDLDIAGYVKAREAIAAEHSYPFSPINYKVKWP